jgi:uncharacterized membrane protein
MKRVSCSLIVLGLFLGAGGQAEAGFTFVTIAPPGSSESVAEDINAAGQIVGQYGIVPPGRDIGFLLSGGSYTPIDPPGSTGTSAATGINDAGKIVGFYFGSGNFGEGTNHGYLLSGGSYTTIDVPGAAETFAFGINDAGEIVGADFGIGSSDLGFLATPGAVPEPSALTMFGIGTLGILVYARFRLRPDAL